MSRGQAVEVDEEAVPRPLLNIALLERLKGQMGSAPGESGNDIEVLLENIERCTLFAAGEV